MRNLRVIDNPQSACTSFMMELKKLLASEEKVVVSVPGGNSIIPFLESLPGRKDMLSEDEWKRVHFFFTDERMVLPGDPDSNYGHVRTYLENLVPLRNIHRVKTELSRKEALLEYNSALVLTNGGKIDIPLLGVGEDGHIASLFPDHSALEVDARRFLFIDDSPKPPPMRITISPRHITESKAPFLFFMSEKKQVALESFMDPKMNFRDCPAKIAIQGAESQTAYLVTDLKIKKSRD